MLEVTAAGWTATVAVIIGLLGVDWLALGRRTQTLSLGEAARWSLFYIGVSVAFGVVLALLEGWDFGTQYFAGYTVEKSLSVDNLFVFVIIISGFAVPPEQQPKALTLGIVLALALRALFILLGAALLEAFSVMFLVFGLALILTAIQLYRHRNEDPHVGDNPIVELARRTLPVSNGYEGGRIMSRRSGRKMVTPLFLVLLAIGSSDLLFAFDSIPAVFGITDHAYIVFAANAFALLGLRPLFFLVAGVLDRLVYMSTGLTVILAFIGVKLALEFAHSVSHSVPQPGTALSLGVIVLVLALTALASALASRRSPTARAHPGSLRLTGETSIADSERGGQAKTAGEAAIPTATADLPVPVVGQSKARRRRHRAHP
jgi:tellurite resistance protein TerC